MGSTRERLIPVLSALAGPPLVAAVIVPWRDEVTPVNAALVLVLVVVAVAASGHRVAAALAALSAAVWFDFLLTRPYETLAISSRADVETAVLLLVVGLAVGELAWWGRQQQAERSRVAGYLDGIAASVEAVADNSSPGVVVEQASRQIANLLQVRCRFDYGGGVIGGNAPRLRPDGEVEVNGRALDVETVGLPLDRPTEILISSSGRYLGRFVLFPEPGSRPALAQRLAAVTLADRAAQALANTAH